MKINVVIQRIGKLMLAPPENCPGDHRILRPPHVQNARLSQPHRINDKCRNVPMTRYPHIRISQMETCDQKCSPIWDTPQPDLIIFLQAIAALAQNPEKSIHPRMLP